MLAVHGFNNKTDIFADDAGQNTFNHRCIVLLQHIFEEVVFYGHLAVFICDLKWYDGLNVDIKDLLVVK